MALFVSWYGWCLTNFLKTMLHHMYKSRHSVYCVWLEHHDEAVAGPGLLIWLQPRAFHLRCFLALKCWCCSREEGLCQIGVTQSWRVSRMVMSGRLSSALPAPLVSLPTSECFPSLKHLVITWNLFNCWAEWFFFFFCPTAFGDNWNAMEIMCSV